MKTFRIDWILVLLCLSVYSIGFFIYYPEVVVSRDSTYYLLQAKNFSEGVVWTTYVDPLTDSIEKWASYLPIGTSLLLALFYFIGGLKASFLLPLISLLFLVMITAKWISENGNSPLFSLLVLSFPAALTLGRVPLSDIPTGMFVALTCWFFWQGANGRKVFGFLSGLFWVLISVFREPGIIILAPLFIGSFFRKDRNLPYIIVGAVIGIMLKLFLNKLIWNVFFHSASRGEFGIDVFLTNTIYYSMVLLFLFPGGLIALIMYRGSRWTELLLGGIAYFILHGLFNHLAYYDLLKSLVNGPRYFIPLTPILAFQMAEVYPSLKRKIERKIKFTDPNKVFSFIKNGWLMCVFLFSLSVHIFMGQFEKKGVTIRDTIYSHTSDRSLIITEQSSTFKYINNLYGKRHLLDMKTISKYSEQRETATTEIMRELLSKYSNIQIVVLERYENYFRQKKKKITDDFIKSINFMISPAIKKIIDRNRILVIYNVRDLD